MIAFRKGEGCSEWFWDSQRGVFLRPFPDDVLKCLFIILCLPGVALAGNLNSICELLTVEGSFIRICRNRPYTQEDDS